MRSSNQQLREPIVNIDDIKDQLNLLVHEIRSFTTRIDEMSSSPMGLKYGFDCCFDYFLRVRDIKSKTKGIKTPNKPIILLVLMILECLKKGPKSERDIKDFVTEKCRKCGVKATNRGTIAGANLEISSACNILGALGILEQAHIDDRVEPELYINPSLPEPPTDEDKAEDFLSLLAYRWSKTIETVVSESQNAEIASSTSITAAKPTPTVTSDTQYEANSSLHSQEKPTKNTKQNNRSSLKTENVGGTDHDEMDFVDILIESSDHLDLRRSHNQSSHSATMTPSVMPPSTSIAPTENANDPQAKAPTDSQGVAQSESQRELLSSQQRILSDTVSTSVYSESERERKSHLLNVNVGSQVSSEIDQLPSTGANNKEMSFPTSANSIEARGNEQTDSISMAAVTVPGVNKPGMTRKSASSTKIWRLKKELGITDEESRTTSLKREEEHEDGKRMVKQEGVEGDRIVEDEITRFLFCPEKFLEKWGESSFYQNASLEIEEKILRRLASQCSLGLRSKDVTSIPSHVGTKYLDNHFDVSGSEIVPMLTVTATTPAATTAPSSSSKAHRNQREPKGGQSNHNNSNSNNTNPKTGSATQQKSDRAEHRLSRNPSIDTLNDGEDNSAASTGSSKNTAARDYETNGSPTAQSLIDKVRKSKRHRGSSLIQHLHQHHHSHPLSSSTSSSSSIHQFTNSSLGKLKNVCQASSQGYWSVKGGIEGSDRVGSTLQSGDNSSASHRKQAKHPSSGEALSTGTTTGLDDRVMSVAEYMKYCQQQQVSLTNQYLHSSQFNAQQLLMSGSTPSVNLSLLRKYVAPLTVIDYESIVSQSKGSQFSHSKSKGGSEHEVVNSPICYPDVMITTLEIPWKSIVSEFQTVRSEEMGLSFIPTDQLATSLSNAPSMDVSDYGGTPMPATVAGDSLSSTYHMSSMSRRTSSVDCPSPMPPSSSASQGLPVGSGHHSSSQRMSRSKSKDFLHRSISFDTSAGTGSNPQLSSTSSPPVIQTSSQLQSQSQTRRSGSTDALLGPSASTPGPVSASTVTSTIFKCRSVSEVIAPSFRELIPDEIADHHADQLVSKSYDGNHDMMYEAEAVRADLGEPSETERRESRERRLSDNLEEEKDRRNGDNDHTIDDDHGDEEEDEDTSDEHYLAKHEEVLRSMREKWALMQKLKMETRKEGTNTHNGLTHNKRSFSSLQSPYKLQRVASNGTEESTRLSNVSESAHENRSVVMKSGGSSGSHRKRSYSALTVSHAEEGVEEQSPGLLTNQMEGSSASASASSASLVKKRGRPPKIQKTSHIHNGKVTS